MATKMISQNINLVITQSDKSEKTFKFEIDKLAGVIADLNNEGYHIAATAEYMYSNLHECNMGYFGKEGEEAMFKLVTVWG